VLLAARAGRSLNAKSVQHALGWFDVLWLGGAMAQPPQTAGASECATDSYPMGVPSCRCLNASMVAALVHNITHAQVGYQHYTAFSEGAVYPPSYGQGCSAHDMHLLPYCVPQWCGDPINDECVPRWCAEQWCWVDEASCSGVPSPMPTSYFAPLRLTYSYEACNATNVFSAFYEGKTAPRPPPPPPYTPPRLPPSPPSRTYDVEWAIGSAATAALLLAFASVCYQLYRIIRSHQQEKRAAAREQAMAAIETTRQMRFVRAPATECESGTDRDPQPSSALLLAV
jgi:hypothetical protein